MASTLNSIILDGLPGTGTTTVSELVAEQLGFEFVYVGGLQREYAKELGLTIEEFNQEIRNHPEREQELDKRLSERVHRGGVVLDSRVQARLPQNAGAHRVLLTCEVEERQRRVGNRDVSSEAADKMRRREALEELRFEELYGVGKAVPENYDQTIDTTNVPAAEVARRIIDRFRQR